MSEGADKSIETKIASPAKAPEKMPKAAEAPTKDVEKTLPATERREAKKESAEKRDKVKADVTLERGLKEAAAVVTATATEASKHSTNVAKSIGSGLSFTLDKIGNGLVKVTEFFAEIWKSVEPRIAKMMGIPAFKWMIGAEHAKMLQEWLGYDEFREQIRMRLPDKTLLVSGPDDKRAGLILNDKFTEMMRLSGHKDMNKIEYFNMLTQKDEAGHVALDLDRLPANPSNPAEKLLTMDDIAKAAQTYNEAHRKTWMDDKKKISPHPAPPAAPTPAA